MAGEDVRWTAKLPTLLAGLALILIGLLATIRGRVIAGVLALMIGLSFVGYSLTIKEWCEARVSAFGGGFHPTFAQCLRQKGWLSF